MHRLADWVVAPEGEGNIADSPAGLASRQGFFDFPDRLDELHRITVVLLNPGGHREDVDVKDDVLRGETRFFGQQSVSPPANLHLAFSVGRLPLFVECHHDDGGPVAPGLAGLLEERPLPFLQADGIHHRFALHALQTCLQNRPLGAVQHQRYPGNFRLAGNQVEEPGHARLPVQQRLIKVDVDQVGSGFHLLARHRYCLVKFLLFDQGGKSRGSRHVGPLPDRSEGSPGSDRVGFQTTQHRGGRRRLRYAGRQPLHSFPDRRDVLRGRSTTSPDHVEKSRLSEFPKNLCHLLRGLIITPKSVRQTGVRITTDKTVRYLRQGRHVRPHLLRAEGAVDPHTEGAGVADRVPESLRGLTGKGTTGGVRDRHRNHHGKAVTDLVKNFLDRPKRRLEIERVEGGFRQQHIHPALDQGPDLLSISLRQLAKSHRPVFRAIHIGRHGGRAVGRPDRPCHPSHSPWIRLQKFVRGFPCQPGGGQVDVPHRGFQGVIRLGDRGGVKGVGLNDLRARLEVGLVDASDHIRPGDRQNIVVSLEVLGMGDEALSPEILFRQVVPLDHGSHGPVHEHDPLPQRLFELVPLPKNPIPRFHRHTLKERPETVEFYIIVS